MGRGKGDGKEKPQWESLTRPLKAEEPSDGLMNQELFFQVSFREKGQVLMGAPFAQCLGGILQLLLIP